jgi:MarR family transcriptional regulator for hemolysin
MEKIESVIFYHLDKCIKSYRQYAQRRLNEAGLDITVDQWLVLNTLVEQPGISQQLIAEKVFKDAASVTRIIELLVKKKFIKRTAHAEDRRRFSFDLTASGKSLMKGAQKVVTGYRNVALKNIPESALQLTKQTLMAITANCEE